MSARPARDGQRGFTIIELMIAMTLCTLVIGVAFQIGIIVVNGYRQHREAIGMQRAARAAIDLISDAARNGSAAVSRGTIVDAAACTPMNAFTVVNSTTGPDELYVVTATGALVTSLRAPLTQTDTTIRILDGSGLNAGDELLLTDFDNGHVVRLSSQPTQSGFEYLANVAPGNCAGVTFTYAAGALALRVRVAHFYVQSIDGVPTLMLDDDSNGPDAPEPLAEGIEDFQVAVGVDMNGDGRVDEGSPGSTTDEWFYNVAGDGPPPAVTTRAWRALRLTVVARTLKVTTGPTWSARPRVEDHAAGVADNYRRRTVSTRVEIRNLEGSP